MTLSNYKKYVVLVNSNPWFFENFREAAAFAHTAEFEGSIVEIYKLVYANGEVLKE